MGIKFFLCGYCKKSLVGLRFYHNGKGFKVINAFMLFKTFCNPTSFVSLNIIINISPMFKGLFCCQNMLICEAFNKFSNSIDNECIIFGLHSFFLFASFATLYCFLKARKISCRAFSFTYHLNKSLGGLTQYMSQCILKESLTRSEMRKII